MPQLTTSHQQLTTHNSPTDTLPLAGGSDAVAAGEGKTEIRSPSSGNNYDAWDRFGRTLRQQWYDYGTAATIDQVNYTYNYAGNRLTRNVTGASALNQTYTYDELHRLQSVDEDTASTTNDRFWDLDQLGNWDELFHNATGSGTATQVRGHNAVNEITSIDQGQGMSTYDAAGNMTILPDPDFPLGDEKVLRLKYDAWNRVVEVKDDSSTVIQTNEFDDLNRRIVRDETGGSGDKIHYYYNEQWQVLEERKEVSGTIDPDPLAQYAYHPDYVDAIAVRFYDENTDGAGIVAQYYLQDANFNVTAVADDSGAVVERYTYTPYGEVTFLASNFSPLLPLLTNCCILAENATPKPGCSLIASGSTTSSWGDGRVRIRLGMRGALSTYMSTCFSAQRTC